MKKYLLLFLFVFMICIHTQTARAAQTNKRELPFEVTSIEFDDQFMKIKGWGIFVESHHFNSAATHSYELTLTSAHDQKTYTSVPSYHSQTDTMRMMGVRKCGSDEYYQRGSVCYYNYDYAGFSFKVPLNDLKLDENYVAKLTIHSNILPTSKSTYLFYPSLIQQKQRIGTIEYRINSDLYETQLKVVDFGVFDRISPSKHSKIHQSRKICSFMYGYDRYFDEGSTYQHVYDRYVNESTTFYKVKTDASSVCRGGRNVVKEGSSHDSWIASNWVDFSGVPLSVQVVDINQPPKIDILSHPSITPDESSNFNFKDFIKATDPEDGNLTEKVIVVNNVDLSKEGVHEMHLKVSDSHGKTAENKLIVTVVHQNRLPIIYAENKTIYQYDDFSYTEGVSAIDEEDGDLTAKLQYEGRVDTHVLGNYPLTYTVSDAENATAVKSITVSVIRNPKERIRYISKNESKLFYKESIPINWLNMVDYLKEQLESPKEFARRSLEK